jgi:hypothetical protein
MYRSLAALAALAASLNAGAASAEGGRWTFSTGVDYTSGDYGEPQDTTIVTVPLIAGFTGDRWGIALTVPFVHIDGPGTIVPSTVGDGGGMFGGLLGGADAASPVAPPGGVNETGLGDVLLELQVVPFVTEGGTQITATGRIKAPTADADRKLGTGEASAAIAAGLRQMLGQRAAVYGSVGYEQVTQGQSGVFADVGAEGYVADRVLLGAAFDFTQASSALQRDAARASAYIGVDVSSSTRVLAYGSAGLTDTSPDVGAGLRVVFTSD